MIMESLLAATVAAATLAPTLAAEPDIPALSTAHHQATTGQIGTGGAGRTTSYQAATSTYPATRLYPSAVPPRPHYVAGYTTHALEMAQRGITKAQVEALVASPTPGSYQDDNDTWIITDGYLIVVINMNAWIVTGMKGAM